MSALLLVLCKLLASMLRSFSACIHMCKYIYGIICLTKTFPHGVVSVSCGAQILPLGEIKVEVFAKDKLLAARYEQVAQSKCHRQSKPVVQVYVQLIYVNFEIFEIIY